VSFLEISVQVNFGYGPNLLIAFNISIQDLHCITSTSIIQDLQAYLLFHFVELSGVEFQKFISQNLVLIRISRNLLERQFTKGRGMFDAPDFFCSWNKEAYNLQSYLFFI